MSLISELNPRSHTLPLNRVVGSNAACVPFECSEEVYGAGVKGTSWKNWMAGVFGSNAAHASHSGVLKRCMVLEVECREPVGRVEWQGWLEVMLLMRPIQVFWRGVWCWRWSAGNQLEELNGRGGWRWCCSCVPFKCSEELYGAGGGVQGTSCKSWMAGVVGGDAAHASHSGVLKRCMVLEVECREKVGRVEWQGWLEVMLLMHPIQVFWRWCWRWSAGNQLQELNGRGGWRWCCSCVPFRCSEEVYGAGGGVQGTIWKSWMAGMVGGDSVLNLCWSASLIRWAPVFQKFSTDVHCGSTARPAGFIRIPKVRWIFVETINFDLWTNLFFVIWHKLVLVWKDFDLSFISRVMSSKRIEIYC